MEGHNRWTKRSKGFMMEHHCKFSMMSRVERLMPKPSVLWIDGVGSFALCEQSFVSIGQSIPGNDVDLAIRGDLSRRACAIHHSNGEHWFERFQSHRDLQESSGISPSDAPILMKDSEIFTISERIKIRYRRSSPWSGTARLDLVSEHRWQPYVDAVILVAENILIGCNSSCHIRYFNSQATVPEAPVPEAPVPDLQASQRLDNHRSLEQDGESGRFVLFKNNQEWLCRVSGKEKVWVGNELQSALFAVKSGQRVQSDSLTFTLEI
jgi:hypothetical protein